MLENAHRLIEKAIIKSQHCQRNWDLSKEIPEEDLNLLITAATECPSKQNVAFYKTHFITNRALIEAIHDNTWGFTTNQNPRGSETNSQTLANLLIVFEEFNYDHTRTVDIWRNEETHAVQTGELKKETLEILKRDKNMAIGVAAGYLNLTASLMGYATGCCACFNGQGIKEILNLEGDVLLLMGIGHKDPALNRRVHHLRHDFVFPTKQKEPIAVNIIR